jgi:hypothetical protein
MTAQLTTIGRAVRMTVGSTPGIPAKVDTGADRSSIWATEIREAGGKLHFVLFDEHSNYFTGEVITVAGGNYRKTRVANSFGVSEDRFVVTLPVEVNGRRIQATFSLSNRHNKVYPILIGCSLLNKKFVVDVSINAEALTDAERKKIRELRLAISQTKQ